MCYFSFPLSGIYLPLGENPDWPWIIIPDLARAAYSQFLVGTGRTYQRHTSTGF